MKQRVAIARTLVNDPSIVLMDEPFGALDSQTRGHLQKFLFQVWQQSKKTVVFVTHNIDEAVFLGQRVIGFSNRELLQLANKFKCEAVIVQRDI